MPRPRIPDRRNRILDAAEELILQTGFDRMSVQEIAARVGIAKGAVYREFSSKDEILAVLLDRSMQRMTRAADRQLAGDDPPALSRAYAVSAEVLLDDPLMSAAFLDDRSVLGTYVDRVVDDRYRHRYRMLVDWVRSLQEVGTLPASVDPEGLGLALSSTTIGLLHVAQQLGPITRDQLRSAIDSMATLLAAFEAPG